MMANASQILMPKLGLTMTEGLVASWAVKPGDEVKPGDLLFVVETEKVASDVLADEPGRIDKILVAEGETVPVGTPVCALATGAGGSARASAPAAPSPSPRQGAQPAPTAAANGPVEGAPARAGGRIVATPLARRAAREAGVDLARLAGSGPKGRIKFADVEAALAARPAARPQASGEAARRAPTRVERVIADRLTHSKQTIPHFYVLRTVDVTALTKLRAELNDDRSRRALSVTHFIVAAVGRALAEMPDMNAVWRDEGIETLASTDVGVAVDVESGLVVPVLRDAGRRSLDALAGEMEGLVARARARQLAVDDMQGGAIAVSNVGMYGASYLVPVIDPAQSSILGVGAASELFRPDENGAPRLAREIGLTLSCDHRIHNGVRAARFLEHVAALLERPLRLLRG